MSAPDPGQMVEPGTPQYHPRDPNEWQGMLVDTSVSIYCEGFCGLALACVDSVCGPCTSDDQCMAGEVCVLDHCVLESLVECRSYSDCAEGGLCLLSGLTGGTARGNEDMRSYCLGAQGGDSMMDPMAP